MRPPLRYRRNFVVEKAAAKPEKAPPPKPKRVYFVSPRDGQQVGGLLGADGKVAVQLKFGVEGMDVKPAGTDAPNSGHHHVIIDGESIPDGQPVPMDEQHIHFGKGQTEAGIRLTPGKHTLTMQFANFAHMSYGARMAQKIELMVVEQPPATPPTEQAADKAPPAPKLPAKVEPTLADREAPKPKTK